MQKRLGSRGLSTAAAAVAAMAVVLAVSSIMIAMTLPKVAAVTGSVVDRLDRAERKIPVRLSTVYHVPPILVVSNDGTTPVTITAVYLDGVEAAIQPLTIPPSERATLIVGLARKVAVEVEGWGAVVLESAELPLPAGAGGGGGLSVNFRCMVPAGYMPIWFLATASGGSPPYTFTINYGDGSQEDYIGYAMLKKHFYTMLPRTAVVTVTDMEGNISTSSLVVAEQCERSYVPPEPPGGGGDGPLSVSATCTVSASATSQYMSSFRLDCNVQVNGTNPPYGYSMTLRTTLDFGLYPYTICSTGGTASSNGFSDGCYRSGSLSYDRNNPRVNIYLSVSKGNRTVDTGGTCALHKSGTRASCSINLSGTSG